MNDYDIYLIFFNYIIIMSTLISQGGYGCVYYPGIKCSGEVETDILSEGTDKIVKDIPLKRLGLPEEVANTIFFLCNNQSSFISGAEVHFNGCQHV